MIFDVVGSAETINFQPETLVEEVLQNVRTLLATPINSVPMDRDFGIDMAFLDMPITQSIAMMNAEVIQKIKRYEPRAHVKRVTHDGASAADGQTRPRVVIEVRP